MPTATAPTASAVPARTRPAPALGAPARDRASHPGAPARDRASRARATARIRELSAAIRDAVAPAAAPADGTLPDGLVYVTDERPGYTRERRGKDWIFRDTRGRRITDEPTLQRIRKLAIPPAYEQVWICPRADGHLQATGRDARGRKQYRYHADWQAGRGADKFARMREFGRALPRIRARVQRDLDAANGRGRVSRELVLATLVRLLDTTFMRVGNEEYAQANGSFGLTTLRRRHAQVGRGALRLRFIGKSGVRHDLKLDDRRVVAAIRRCRDLPGQELFCWEDDDGEIHRVNSSDVNAYLAEAAGGARVTAKDFRTWHGSVLALELTCEACRAPVERGAAKGVVEQVAQRLGNTPAVCRKAYIHPEVLGCGDWLEHDDGREMLQSQPWCAAGVRGTRYLRAAERRLLALIEPKKRARSAS